MVGQGMTLCFDPARAAYKPRPYQAELTAALVAATTPLVPGTRCMVHVATGGGKRMICNDFMRAKVCGAGLRALVLAKDWALTWQLADDFVAREGVAPPLVSVVGNPPDPSAFAPARFAPDGRVVFSTLQTCVARRESLQRERFDVVLVDESHWGERASLQRIIYEMFSGSAVFVGATATPLTGSPYTVIGRPYGFRELVDLRVLADPIVTTIRTGIEWDARRGGAHGDFVGSSLARLGLHPRRNRQIVDTYVTRRAEFGKAIVFACDIAHVEELTRTFCERGVATAGMHCKLPSAENANALERFRAGEIDVLVNMGMLTHGVDVPDVTAILLARPTVSDVLMSQMIGRGARRTATKTSFHILSFVDTSAGGTNELALPETFVAPSSRVRRGPCPPIAAHGFVPAPFVTIEGEPGMEALDGLEINPQQTFGIEFEATRLPRAAQLGFEQGGRALLDALRANIPTALEPMPVAHSRSKDNTVWNCEPDSSCGFEITTRILQAESGFVEVVDACARLCAAIKTIGLTVNRRCVGTHIHLGAKLDRQQITNLLAIAAWFEPAIISLLPPSRAEVQYVRSVRPFLRTLGMLREGGDWRETVAQCPHYMGVNVRNLVDGLGTIEIRFHSGTIDAAKILAWTSLWMRIADAARLGACPGDPLRNRVRTRPLCAGPRGDVRALCAFVGAGPRLTERLVARRNDVVGRTWARHEEFGERNARLLEEWQRDEQPTRIDATGGDL